MANLFFGSEIFEKLMKIYDLGQGRCKSRIREAAATFRRWRSLLVVTLAVLLLWYPYLCPMPELSALSENSWCQLLILAFQWLF